MTLEQAIREQVEIICQNEQERDEVVKILEAGGLKEYVNHGGLCISIFSVDGGCDEYGIYDTPPSPFWPHVPASQFIAPNKINHEINPPLTC